MSRLPPVARHDKSHSVAIYRRAVWQIIGGPHGQIIGGPHGQIIGGPHGRWRETRQVVTFGSKSSKGRLAIYQRAAWQIIGGPLGRWRETRQVVTFGSESSAGRMANHRLAAWQVIGGPLGDGERHDSVGLPHCIVKLFS